jgi:uncharacterized protein (DUF697 family)
MDKKARRITHFTSGLAAVTAFAAQPIPALDEALVIPIHYYMVTRLARERGVSVFKLPWRNIQRVIWYGAGARLATHLTIGLVPVSGAVVTALTAIALTEYLGRYLDQVLADPAARPAPLSVAALKDLFDRAVQRMKHRETAPGEPVPAENVP